MIFGTFGKKIENSAAALVNPGGGFSAIHKTEDFHTLKAVPVFRPFQDGAQTFFFSFGHSCRADFKPVNMQVRNEKTCDLELFSWSVRDAGSLLAVAQCGVKHLDITGESVVLFHSVPVFLHVEYK